MNPLTKEQPVDLRERSVGRQTDTTSSLSNLRL
jgi:hypothetical protein